MKIYKVNVWQEHEEKFINVNFTLDVDNGKRFGLRDKNNLINLIGLLESARNTIVIWEKYGNTVLTDGEVDVSKIPKDYNQDEELKSRHNYIIEYEVENVNFYDDFKLGNIL